MNNPSLKAGSASPSSSFLVLNTNARRKSSSVKRVTILVVQDDDSRGVPQQANDADSGKLIDFEFTRSRGPLYQRLLAAEDNEQSGDKILNLARFSQRLLRRMEGTGPALEINLKQWLSADDTLSITGAINSLIIPHAWERVVPSFFLRLMRETSRELPWSERIRIKYVGGTDPHNITGASSTLGMALGILMAGTTPKVYEIIATGKLAAKSDGNGRPILPIGGLQNKINGVLQKTTSRRYKKTPFFIPWQDKDGNLLRGADREDRFKQIFTNEISSLENLNISLMPVDTLEDAAGKIGALRIAPTLRDYIVLLIFLMMLGLSGIYFWHEQSVKLEWSEPLGVNFLDKTKPLYRMKNQEDHVIYPLAKNEHGIPVACHGEIVGISVRATDVGIFTPKVQLGMIEATTVHSNNPPSREKLDPGILSPDLDSKFQWKEKGELFGLAAQVKKYSSKGEEETNAIFVIADRYPGISAATSNQLAPPPPDGLPMTLPNIDSVRRYIDLNFPGRAKMVTYDVVEAGGKECLK